MRKYNQSAFNMTIAIFTEDKISDLLSNWEQYKKRQIYIYMDHKPMIAIMICDAKQTIAS